MPNNSFFSLLMVMTVAYTTSYRTNAEEVHPFNYADNPVGRLQEALNNQTLRLHSSDNTRYLSSLLQELKISPTSQCLVFSKTSLQRYFIKPDNPRAIYFNDAVYVGFVEQANLIEIAVADPDHGTLYYVLPQSGERAGKLVLQGNNCLSCHRSERTEKAPGHLSQSVFADGIGEPRGTNPSGRVDQSTPFSIRWGGWYVTGTHQPQIHLGNTIYNGLMAKIPEEIHAGINITDLKNRFRTDRYLTSHSDLVAMLVREHQQQAHNLLSRVIMESHQVTDSTENASHDSLKEYIHRFFEYMTFQNEITLPGPIVGTSGYREYFESLGPFDDQGRSLRQFDLESRLFRYPVSYLIYSESFQSLPAAVRRQFWNKVTKWLHGKNDQHRVSDTIRQHTIQILRETVPEFTQ